MNFGARCMASPGLGVSGNFRPLPKFWNAMSVPGGGRDSSIVRFHITQPERSGFGSVAMEPGGFGSRPALTDF